MAKKKKDFKSTKVKKRVWVEIIAPSLFNSQSLGFTHVDEKEDVIGKTMTLNLMTLTGDPKKQGYAIKFKIVRLDGEKARTEFIGWKMLPSSLKRIVRRNRNRIDASFVCQTQDEKHIRIKPLVITRSKGNSSLVKSIRKHMTDFVIRAVRKQKLENLAIELTMRKFQNQFRERMQKLHPIAACDVRVVTVVVPKKGYAAEAKETPAEKAAEAKE